MTDVVRRLHTCDRHTIDRFQISKCPSPIARILGDINDVIGCGLGFKVSNERSFFARANTPPVEVRALNTPHRQAPRTPTPGTEL